MKLRRLLSCILALLLASSLPLTAFAAEYDLAEGSVTVNATETGQTVTHGSNDAVPDDAPVITQSSETTTNTITITATENATANVTIQDVNIVISDPAGSPQNHSGQAAVSINVAENAEANVTLDGVNINTKNTGGRSDSSGTAALDFIDGEAAVQITGNGDVTLELDGENTVQSGYMRSGVEKNTTDSSGNGNLTITDEYGTNSSLNATGGNYGSGIGGGSGGSGSNITISGGTVEATGGKNGSGIGGGGIGSGSDITIDGNAEVTAKGGKYGSGIGGGLTGSGSNITISGSAKVTAKGGASGSGIGGGSLRSGSDITISEDAQVKAQGGAQCKDSVSDFGVGAAIGDGGKKSQNSTDNIAGEEKKPNTDSLTTNGKIEYYAPGADMKTEAPTKVVTGTYVPPQPEDPVQPENPVQPTQPKEEVSETAQPLYQVLGQDGKALACQTAWKDGVLTITVDADFATLTGSFSGMKTLQEQGIDTIVFETNGASSTFALSDLLAQGSTGDTYQLTHDGETVTFTLGSGTDLSKLLKSAD